MECFKKMNSNRFENTEFKKLIGSWKTEGRILATENSPEMYIMGTDTYEPILGGFFILHKADVEMGDQKSQTFEIIRLDEGNEQATFEYYNNQGSWGKMTGILKNNVLAIDGKGLRFNGHLNDREDQITGFWEKSGNQKDWKRFLEMKLTKVEPE